MTRYTAKRKNKTEKNATKKAKDSICCYKPAAFS